MTDERADPTIHVVVVFAVLSSFALLTTTAVVAVGVTPVAEAVPASPDGVPDQLGDAVPGVDDRPRERANATVTGTVRGPDGEALSNATVALAPAPEPMFVKATPGELGDVLDGEASDDLYAVRTDANGSFALEVPAGEYDAIALHGENVSAVGRVNATGTASLSLAVTDDRPMTYRASGGRAAPGGTATVTVAAYNNDAAAKNVTLSLERLPDGWVVESYGGNADAVDEAANAFAFERLGSGEWAKATVTVRVPEDAVRGDRYRFEALATAPTPGPNATAVLHWSGNATVFVPPEETTQPTTNRPGDDGDGTGTTVEPETSTDPAADDGSNDRDSPLPGFGVAVAAVALGVAALGLARRR
ncbi:NEW3 domain-containing protein [Halorubellus sp. PRR65]|uniref:NEW3 domain-containing protein n=1 Tax=Halorubellus sp. PRR65 TaxID=3098148 RepID=UPI002B261402|nr:NEW3 domain-containing protein [Halorubellus sp. PRR65]